MQLIKQLEYLNVFFDQDSQVLKTTWNQHNAQMLDADIKATILACVDLIKTLKPVYFLANDLNRAFAYPVDTQKWVAMTLAQACIEVELKKYAILLPDELIAQLSTEQTVEEAGQLPFEIQYFDNEEKALEWINT